MKTQVDNLRLTFNKLAKEYTNKENILQALRKNCDAIREYLAEKETELTAERKAKRKTERQTMNDLGEKQIQLDELQEQNDVYLEQIKALKEEILLIMQMSEQAMEILMRDPVKLEATAKSGISET